MYTRHIIRLYKRLLHSNYPKIHPRIRNRILMPDKSFVKFIGQLLRKHSRAVKVGSSMSSKRQYHKSDLNDDIIKIPREIWVYCWCRIVSIFLSENLLVKVDIYNVGLSWCRLKSSSNTGLFFPTVLIKLLQNSFAPDWFYIY